MFVFSSEHICKEAELPILGTCSHRLSDERSEARCARVRDPVTHHMNVIIACGYIDDLASSGTRDEATYVEAWDLETDQVRVLMGPNFVCPADSGDDWGHFGVADGITEFQVLTDDLLAQEPQSGIHLIH